MVQETSRTQQNGRATGVETAHALRLHGQAKRWADHATACGMQPGIAYSKALDALEFSLWHGANRLCIPSKLVGTKPNQENVARLAEQRAEPGTAPLVMEEDEKGNLQVFHGSHLLGRVQAKHVGWLRAVLPHVRVHLLQCTGGTEGKTRGVNIVFSFSSGQRRRRPQQAEDPWVAVGGWEQ